MITCMRKCSNIKQITFEVQVPEIKIILLTKKVEQKNEKKGNIKCR